MDTLKDIIQTFSEDDSKEFSVFINRQKKITSRKDLELFKLLFNENKNRKEVVSALYKDMNKNAYHSLRKRLIKHIAEFIVLKNNREDITSSSAIMNQLSLARYLFRKKQNQAAWIYLLKTEKLAADAKEYQLLNSIYYTQIENSDNEYATELRTIIKKKKENLKLALIDDRANTANHLIKHRLLEASKKDEGFDIDKVVDNILEENKLTKEVRQNPKLIYNIISIIRSNILVKKDFISFEPYVINKYSYLIDINAFNQYNHYYKINILYIIAHVLYRNKKFYETENYLKTLHSELLKFNKSYYTLLYPLYVLLLGNIYAYTARSKEAISLLEKSISESIFKLDKIRQISAYLNLTSYYCESNNYLQAAKTLAKIHQSDNWLIKNLGKERTLTKQLLECALQVELGNSEYAASRIKSTEKSFSDLLDKSTFYPEKVLLNVIKKLNDNPFLIKDKAFQEEIKKYLTLKPADHDNLQSMIFYIWLKAKLEKKSYNEVILKFTTSK